MNAKKEGIKRFTIDQYSAYYGVNGMIGFVIEKMNIDNNINNINQLLENQSPQITTIKKLQFIRLILKNLSIPIALIKINKENMLVPFDV